MVRQLVSVTVPLADDLGDHGRTEDICLHVPLLIKDQ